LHHYPTNQKNKKDKKIIREEAKMPEAEEKIMGAVVKSEPIDKDAQNSDTSLEKDTNLRPYNPFDQVIMKYGAGG